MVNTLPSCIEETSVPKLSSKELMVLMSESLGAFVSVRGSSLSNVAGIKVRQAFFAPAIGISPRSSPPPVTKIESLQLSFLSDFSPPSARARACALRRPIFAFNAAFNLTSRADWTGLVVFSGLSSI
jgi:hypothetical protein